MKYKIVLITTGAVAAGIGMAYAQRRQPPFTQPSSGGYKNEVKITVSSDRRLIESNGIPDHKTGSFPGAGNPHAITPQNHRFTVPVEPKAAEQVTVLGLQDFGIAVNGIPFDPSAAEWWNGNRAWQYEPMYNRSLGIDLNNAHVQPTGAYHYHGLPQDLLKRLEAGSKMVLVGWAADGFPIYGPLCPSDPNDLESPLKKMTSSYRLKSGNRPSGSGPGGRYDGTFTADYEYKSGSGDLDECNGRYGKTAEFPDGTYYYVLTENWPIIPRFYRGTPDPSFQRGPGGPGGPGGRGGRPPRRGGFTGGGE